MSTINNTIQPKFKAGDFVEFNLGGNNRWWGKVWAIAIVTNFTISYTIMDYHGNIHTRLESDMILLGNTSFTTTVTSSTPTTLPVLTNGATFTGKVSVHYPSFTVGDRVMSTSNTTTMNPSIGTVISVNMTIPSVEVKWDIYLNTHSCHPTQLQHYYSNYLAIPTIQKINYKFDIIRDKKCECGAIKSKSTHASWCDVYAPNK
jgi:hypothetical protein